MDRRFAGDHTTSNAVILLTNNITSPPIFLDADGDGLSNLHEMKSQYELIQGSYTWEEARIDAISKGGHLATITSQ